MAKASGDDLSLFHHFIENNFIVERLECGLETIHFIRPIRYQPISVERDGRPYFAFTPDESFSERQFHLKLSWHLIILCRLARHLGDTMNSSKTWRNLHCFYEAMKCGMLRQSGLESSHENGLKQSIDVFPEDGGYNKARTTCEKKSVCVCGRNCVILRKAAKKEFMSIIATHMPQLYDQKE
jgi:hypothetical protein